MPLPAFAGHLAVEGVAAAAADHQALEQPTGTPTPFPPVSPVLVQLGLCCRELRRLVQGRAEILKAEVERRGSGGEGGGSLVDQLATILSSEGQGPSRGEAVKVGLPEEEMLLARRRVERLVADAEISDPGTLDDERLAAAVDLLVSEEHEVSQARSDVLQAMDALQEELKRRYRDDPSLVLS